MGIAAKKPISTLVAPNSSKKLLSKTSAVTQEKIVENIPSRVEAFRLARIWCLAGLVGGTRGAISVTDIALQATSALLVSLRTVGSDRDRDFTGTKSSGNLIIKVIFTEKFS
jgi:hypothetical protein